MDLPGTGYLLTLAALAITFLGFASLLLIFLRPATGGPLTRYDAFFTLSFVQLGFVIVFGSLLPPLLALWAMPEALVWQGASALTAILHGIFCIAAPLRRRGLDAPGRTYFAPLAVPHLIALAILVMTAFNVRLGPGAAPYATAITLIWFTTGLGYYLSLRVLLRVDASSSAPKA